MSENKAITIEEASTSLLDFHSHTNHSDGGDTPTELVKRAKRHGITAMALTDHNIITGLEEFVSACNKEGIFAIPFGVEIYAELPPEILRPEDNEAPDLVILGKNPRVDEYKAYMQVYEHDRLERYIPETLDKLRKMGFHIPKQDISRKEGLGLPLIFHDFVKLPGNFKVLTDYLQSIDNTIALNKVEERPIAFVNKYIYATGRPGYARRIQGFNLKNAISLADALNCKLFIAHPGGEYGWLTDTIIDYYIQSGIHGIEIRSYFNTEEQNKKFDALAEKHNLIKSGGSDCHGDIGPFKIGIHDRPHNQLPKYVLAELMDSLP